MRSRCPTADITNAIAGTATPYAARLGIDAVSNSMYGIAVNDAERAAAVAAAPAACHWPNLSRSSFQVRIAALAGNSQTAAATELSV